MNFRESDTYQVVWLIRRLFRAMGQAADEYLGTFGISAAERATMEFLYPDAKLSVPEIAARYDVSRQHVQVTVNGLLTRGLAVEAPNPRHKRSKLISLSDEGRDLFARVIERDRVAIEQLFSGIDSTGRERVRGVLQAMLDNINHTR
jgi:DNA-binding MarR family transcriptional regulator